MATRDYVNGKVIRCSCSDETGRQLDSSLCVEKEAHFPGEEKDWRKFLEKNLNPDVPVKNRAPEGTYQVIVQFIVDKEGQVTDIKPLTRFGFGMEEEVLRILKNSPRWTPAFQFGRNVKAYRKQPVTFVVSKG
jgi:protein TonB